MAHINLNAYGSAVTWATTYPKPQPVIRLKYAKNGGVLYDSLQDKYIRVIMSDYFNADDDILYLLHNDVVRVVDTKL